MREGEKSGPDALEEWDTAVFGDGDHMFRPVGVFHVQTGNGVQLVERKAVALRCCYGVIRYWYLDLKVRNARSQARLVCMTSGELQAFSACWYSDLSTGSILPPSGLYYPRIQPSLTCGISDNETQYPDCRTSIALLLAYLLAPPGHHRPKKPNIDGGLSTTPCQASNQKISP